MRHIKSVVTCGMWLAYCLRIGWPKSDLDFLESLWWQYHDDNGRLLNKPREN